MFRCFLILSEERDYTDNKKQWTQNQIHQPTKDWRFQFLGLGLLNSSSHRRFCSLIEGWDPGQGPALHKSLPLSSTNSRGLFPWTQYIAPDIPHPESCPCQGASRSRDQPLTIWVRISQFLPWSVIESSSAPDELLLRAIDTILISSSNSLTLLGMFAGSSSHGITPTLQARAGQAFKSESMAAVPCLQKIAKTDQGKARGQFSLRFVSLGIPEGRASPAKPSPGMDPQRVERAQQCLARGWTHRGHSKPSKT